MTTTASDFSECYTFRSDPVSASVVEQNHFWWPVGVKWPTSDPAMVQTMTTVTITKGVSTECV